MIIVLFYWTAGKIRVVTTLGSSWTAWNQTIRNVFLTIYYIDNSGNSTVIVENEVVGCTINSTSGASDTTYDLP